MEPVAIAAIVVGIMSAIGSIASSAINAHNTTKTNRESMDFARESAATAQQNTKDLMDYNSPSYQMGRIVSAGLNPNLAYDNLDTPIPTGAQASQPNLRPPQVNLDTGVNDALAVAQINRLNVASANESKDVDSKITLRFKELGLKDAQIDVLNNQAKSLSQSIAESQQRVSLMSEQQKGVFLDNLFKDASFTERYRQIAAERKISETQAKYEEQYIAAKMLNLNEQAEMYRAQAHLSYKQAKMINELTNVYKEETNNLHIQGQMMDMQLKGMQVKMPGSNVPAGVVASYMAQREKVYHARLVNTQQQMIAKYGNTEHVVGIIESITRSLVNFSDVLAEWWPKHSKSSVGGIINRSTVSHFKP